MSFDEQPDDDLDRAIEHCKVLTRSNEKLRDEIQRLRAEPTAEQVEAVAKAIADSVTSERFPVRDMAKAAIAAYLKGTR